LEYVREVLEENTDENQHRIVNNLVQTYRNKIFDKAHLLISDDAPMQNQDQIDLMILILRVFKENGFGDSHDFQAVESKIILLWRDSFYMAILGKRAFELNSQEKANFVARIDTVLEKESKRQLAKEQKKRK
jgi:hypothetical protein